MIVGRYVNVPNHLPSSSKLFEYTFRRIFVFGQNIIRLWKKTFPERHSSMFPATVRALLWVLFSSSSRENCNRMKMIVRMVICGVTMHPGRFFFFEWSLFIFDIDTYGYTFTLVQPVTIEYSIDIQAAPILLFITMSKEGFLQALAKAINVWFHSKKNFEWPPFIF